MSFYYIIAFSAIFAALGVVLIIFGLGFLGIDSVSVNLSNSYVLWGIFFVIFFLLGFFGQASRGKK